VLVFVHKVVQLGPHHKAHFVAEAFCSSRRQIIELLRRFASGHIRVASVRQCKFQIAGFKRAVNGSFLK
jgi:hypothetical protein